jgi:hypothetical protein
MRRQKLLNWLMIGLLLAGLGLLAAPVLADGGLPDRDPPPARDSGRDDNGDSAPLGAAIELTAWPPGGPSVVQWQDSNGDWQDVEGWRGALDNGGRIRWWVAAKDFGSGPFRWVVGEAASEPFNLPTGAGQTLRVDLTAE